MKSHITLSMFLLVSTIATATAQTQRDYYVTVDGRNPLTFGTYTGLENPNLGNLTFLFAHWNDETPSRNHFHSIGSIAYDGPIEDPVVLSTNSNNRIPEGYTGQAPLTLQPGSGDLSGKLISAATDQSYSDIRLFSIHDMKSAAAETPEAFMYNSSGGGYAATSMDGMNLAIELVAMTPGLFLGVEELSEAGDQLTIGGESDLPFEPIFWTNDDAAPGSYSAEFKLVDLSGTYPSSGTINFDFAVTLPADFDYNGEVDMLDFLVLSEAFGNTVDPAGAAPDLNGNGEVDFADFQILADSFGPTTAAESGVAAIPEPATFNLLGVGALLVGLMRCKRRVA